MSLSGDIKRYNADLNVGCQRNLGITVETFKTVKAITQLAGILMGGFAIQQGAPPFATFLGIVLIWGGPEYFELLLHRNGESDE